MTEADWRKAKRQYGVIKATDFAEDEANAQGTRGKVKIGVGLSEDRNEMEGGKNEEVKQKKVEFPPSPDIKKISKIRQESGIGLFNRKEDLVE